MVQKYFKFGIELELFTLNDKGYMVHEGPRLISKFKKTYPKIDIKEECGKNMIEIGCKPDVFIPNIMREVIYTLNLLLEESQKEGFILYPFGTYPGTFSPEIYEDERYLAQQEIFGKERFKIAARCAGLHCHYTLPWGVFDQVEKIVRFPIRSKHKQSMINIYNLFIAMDPVLVTFSQSSPFYQGAFIGKSSRVIMYRGGPPFNCPKGLFANFQKFGGLPSYIITGTDLLDTLQKRFSEWSDLLEKININVKNFLKHGSILTTVWNPVRLNAHGTTEQRSMDANLPSIILALALIIKFVAKHIQENFIQIVPSDIAVDSPFKSEKNIIYIPPQSHVRGELQTKAAFEGLQNDRIYTYCSEFLKLAKNLMPQNRHYFLIPLENMLKERETMSDKILKKANEFGMSTSQELSKDQAAQLALFFCEEFKKDLKLTMEKLEEFKEEL